jgi:glycosyltransferase involved in cell wall biosynthesis
MRRLLLLTYHFPPSAAAGGFRMLGFARHLPSFGWQPVVVAPPCMPLEPVDPYLAKQIPADTLVWPVPYRHGLLARLLNRALPYSGWLPGALLACQRAIRRHRPQAVLTSGPAHTIHLLGLALKGLHRLPWLADFRDLWISEGTPHRRLSWQGRWEALWERAVLRHADALIANSPGACQALRDSYPAFQHKMTAITNGYDPQDFVAPGNRPAGSETIHIVHAGELYVGRDPRPFLDALQDLCRESPSTAQALRVSFLGRSTDTAFDFRAEIQRRHLGDQVELSGQVAHAEALFRLLQAQALLLLDSPGRRIGVPGKLYEYLGTGRPILALAEAESDVAWVLRESGARFRLAPPGDRARIRQALQELLRECGPRFAAPPPSGCRRFTKEHMTLQLAELLGRCLGNRAAPGRRPARNGRGPIRVQALTNKLDPAQPCPGDPFPGQTSAVRTAKMSRSAAEAEVQIRHGSAVG